MDLKMGSEQLSPTLVPRSELNSHEDEKTGKISLLGIRMTNLGSDSE